MTFVHGVFETCFKGLLSLLVHAYQFLLSPILFGLGVRCRFYPSCSQYALASLEKDKASLALRKIAQRLSKCQPSHHGGIDLP